MQEIISNPKVNISMKITFISRLNSLDYTKL